jgi:hypothetical protein
MTNSLRREEGSALITAMLVMMLFLVLGIVTLNVVDVQQRESGRERTRESSFALSEGALNQQIFMLSRSVGWPASVEGAYVPCTGAGGDARCPDATRLASSFQGVDYASGVQWRTEVHDNRAGNEACTDPPTRGTDFYDDVATRTQPGWDANCDGFLWVRSEAKVRGRTRTIVALVRAEQLTANFPNYALIANSFEIGPSGNQTYIDSGTAGSIWVRCATADGSDPNCAKYGTGDTGKQPQVAGSVQGGYSRELINSPETIERLRDTAKANGTYYAQDPTCSVSLDGPLVFIEYSNCGGYNKTGNAAWNSAASPGMLVIGSGVLKLTGNAIYYGLVYHINEADKKDPSAVTGPNATPSGDVVQIGPGGTRIIGGVVIEGNGGMFVGSNNGGNQFSGNLVFDDAAFKNLRVYGTAGIVQNSFREIKSSAG